ncbi:MAG: hypothetical protein BIP78_0474 [Candidatus Bipolaricaulis sibiricus]|uniref:DUF4384 domain-containing protein n=1 Tax=Bipolaricaulis sibiricus TaxID=2501609 RepID=A0A410FTI3_BIPS1|nr:MAG: hypothetical protein BIP78_0474 [Candidatus Bipolaricaulis sibiricus]
MDVRALAGIFVSLFAISSSAQLSDLTVQRLQGAARLASHPLELQVNDGCAHTYYAGQDMVITVRSPLEGFLYLFHFRADGVVTMMLFPCRHFWGDFPLVARANAPLTIPPEGARVSLAIGSPAGRDALLGMVVPVEQTDLVSYFGAYDAREFRYRTGDQEGFALFLARRIDDLRARGVPCAASVCIFQSADAPRAPMGAIALSEDGCNVGAMFQCSSGGLPIGCESIGADLARAERTELPNTSGPGEDAVLLSAGHFFGSLGEGDWHDWYRMRSPHGEGCILWFDPGGLIVDLYLLHDPCGDVLAECLGVTETTAILVPCYAGMECPGLGECFQGGECRFFIRIVWRGGSGNYRLSLLWEQPGRSLP